MHQGFNSQKPLTAWLGQGDFHFFDVLIWMGGIDDIDLVVMCVFGVFAR
jgi:hypothetical protein